MVNYKLVHVPFPADMAQKVLDTYESSKDSPGGIDIRYRLPKELVKAGSVDGEDFDLDTEEIMGTGLGGMIKMPLLLQPRQLLGFQSAQSKGKSYPLVLTKAQLKAMKGQGLFAKIGNALLKVVAPIVDGLAPGSGDAVEAVGEKVISSIDKQILRPKAKKAVKSVLRERLPEVEKVRKSDLSNVEKARKIAELTAEINKEAVDAAQEVMGSGDCDVCPHCMGSGMTKRKQKNPNLGVVML